MVPNAATTRARSEFVAVRVELIVRFAEKAGLGLTTDMTRKSGRPRLHDLPP